MDNSARSEDTSKNTLWRQARVTESHILLIHKDVTEFWRELGTLLRLPPGEVRRMETDYRSCRERAWRVMERWLEKKGSQATLGILADALENENIGMRRAVEKLIGTEREVEGMLNPVRVQSGRLRKEFEKFREDLRSRQQAREQEIKELKDMVYEMQTTKGEDVKIMKTKLQCLETKIEELETHILSKKHNDNEIMTRFGNISDAMEQGLLALQENIIHETSSEPGNSASDQRNERHLSGRMEETRSVDEIQRNTARRARESQNWDGVRVQPLLDESSICFRCPALEKELNDVKGERDSLKIKIANSDQMNKGQREQIRKLKKSNRPVKVEKNEAIKPNEEMAEEVQKPEAEKKELEMKLNGEINLEAENEKLSTEIEELKKKAKDAEFECKFLQEELKTFINFQSRVFLPAGREFVGICTGVICFLKHRAGNAPCGAEPIASRSSDGHGEASDVLNHKTGVISGTEERENSWWSIDLGSSHLLVITHYALRHGKREKESVLTQWQLKGSNDGKDWETIETIHDRNDPQFIAPTLFCTGKWSVKGEIGPFRFFRIFQTGVNSSGKYGIHLSGIELYGVLLNICELTAKEALTYKVFIKQPK
ncbi:coiled-coil domain-containing protein 150-like [Stylophora pistillata]|uniref:coiled-coil domain-containing protein 150-like n=1 Tax=Stylophora pistillata TaxID=50429 RepID=UPI000C0395F2|nr:coiled-coil domain-containing protein 150-like [Stylophora pistillata]